MASTKTTDPKNWLEEFGTLEPRLPCPFCAGTRSHISIIERDGYENYPEDPDRFSYTVVCNSCAAQGGWSKSSPHSAIRWWNMRNGKR